MLALIALSAPSAAHGSERQAPREFYGVSTQTVLERADFRAMGRGRVGSLRVEIPWGDLDPAPAAETEILTPRPYRWNRVDPTVRSAARRGIRVLPTVYGTPNWVARYQGCFSDCYRLGPSSTVALIAFAQFMRAAVERYGPGGSFWSQHPRIPYMPIRAWQIWNEQNSGAFWKPAANVEDYGNLVIAGGEAVHAADPGAQVILGGMYADRTVPDFDFLAALYENPRLRAAFDGIAVHPYRRTLEQVDRTIRRWRKVLRAAGALGDRIWVTEIGWTSGGEKHPLNVGLRGQARMLDRALEYFTQNRRRYRFAQVDVYSWRDAAPGAASCFWCAKSGLVRYRGRRPKPAWHVFRSYTGALAPG